MERAWEVSWVQVWERSGDNSVIVWAIWWVLELATLSDMGLVNFSSKWEMVLAE